MSTFQPADSATLQLLEAVRNEHHALRLVDVKVSVLMAYAARDDSGEKVGHAIMLHGTAALAKVRVVSLRDRVHGLGDAEIIIDGDEWPLTSEQTKRALLDHELTHLVRTGKVDDIDRPKLKLRAHDFQVGWFHEVAERHGAHSVEVQQAAHLVDDHGQTYFGFAKLHKNRSAAA